MNDASLVEARASEYRAVAVASRSNTLEEFAVAHNLRSEGLNGIRYLLETTSSGATYRDCVLVLCWSADDCFVAFHQCSQVLFILLNEVVSRNEVLAPDVFDVGDQTFQQTILKCKFTTTLAG